MTKDQTTKFSWSMTFFATLRAPTLTWVHLSAKFWMLPLALELTCDKFVKRMCKATIKCRLRLQRKFGTMGRCVDGYGELLRCSLRLISSFYRLQILIINDTWNTCLSRHQVSQVLVYYWSIVLRHFVLVLNSFF